MISTPMKRLRLALGLLVAGTTLAPAGAIAQVAQYGLVEDAGSALNRHLRTLADQPRNLSALMGAGKAALELGDPQAALTFFARAEEIVPRDSRVKAGMGSAFVQMEQAQAALKFFSDAASLGLSQAEYAGDRGLAYDLIGDPRRAQADYNLALSRKEDGEVRRRLALSLAISGERDKALATIDAQLRRQDRAAWRTRAFVLALCGDSAEATRAVEAVMPNQASQMSPFFARLPALSPAQRAMAVHFGHFPNDGQAIQMASAHQYARSTPPTSTATRGGRSETRQPLPGRSNAAPDAASTGPGRRSATDERRAAR
ncbi:MAG: hypothetical protein M3Q08_13605, partial [Pseudomonadota bacterium]|nr:hypothetical protein [Pseudomonadota bacterium]